MSINPPVITVDGPSGAGKGTLCRTLTEQLGWHLLDSGLIYRLLALVAKRQSIDILAQAPLASLAEQLDAKFVTTVSGVQVYFAGEDVTPQLASEQIGSLASQVAALPWVRAALLPRQRAFRQFPGLIADGRDMGTVVFPDALVKIFLYASLEERAERRHRQLQEKGVSATFAQVLYEMRERDYNDTHRHVAALAAAEGALLLDSTAVPFERVVDSALRYIQQKFAGQPPTEHLIQSAHKLAVKLAIKPPTTGSVA